MDYMKKAKRRASVTVSIMFIVLIVVAYFLVKQLNHAIIVHESKVNEIIGSYVVYNGDTLQITNFNMLQNDFTLSNGVEVDAKLLDDLQVIPKSE